MIRTTFMSITSIIMAFNLVSYDHNYNVDSAAYSPPLHFSSICYDAFIIEECSEEGLPNKCCEYWSTGIEERNLMIFGFPYTSYDFSCSTGGTLTCPLGNCIDEQDEELNENDELEV
ncbi:MAG: hypothetical protein JJU46_06895 [Balneolaceae bacterium]|nr:hypothetical protein [Balneolaceae bacterium]MCH8548270.1 hypothetical protein [Balneolaceae bacterium]